VFGIGLARHFSSRFVPSTVVNVVALLQGCSYWSQIPRLIEVCSWSTQLAKLGVR